jgi:hypothetical protein
MRDIALHELPILFLYTCIRIALYHYNYYASFLLYI